MCLNVFFFISNSSNEPITRDAETNGQLACVILSKKDKNQIILYLKAIIDICCPVEW